MFAFLRQLIRMNFQPTWQGINTIFRKELIQLFRDPYLVAFIIALPVMQLLVTGLAVERDLSQVPTIVCNYDKRNASVSLLESFQQSSLFHIDREVASETEVLKAIRRGKYRIGIIIPPDFSEQLMNGYEQAEVNIMVDGTQGNIAKTIAGGAKMVVVNHARKYMAMHHITPINSVADADAGDNQDLSKVVARMKVLYNPKMISAYNLVPGILAIIMHMLTILFTSFAIVREREAGTLEQLMVTPIKSADLMIGKVLPYALIGFLDMLLTIGVMVWFFDIPVSGSFWFLFLGSIIFILTSLGVGLMISTTCQTQVQAIQLTVAIFLPSIMLSGFVFPLEPMPWFIKLVSFSLPITYYIDIIRGVIVKGLGPQELWMQTLVLIAMTLVLVVASIFRFKKQVA
ncbi:MAG: ABC transporter permease [Candidatus Melainabacteria bacterium]